MTPAVCVLIPAGGMGLRFGGGIKKQFLKIAGKTILEITLAKFLAIESIQQIVVAVPKDELENCKRDFQMSRVQFVAGGMSRCDSVFQAFQSLPQMNADDVVLVHDAVRCCVDAEVIQNVIAAITKYGAAIPAIKLIDTIKRVHDRVIVETVDRNVLYSAQTPQGATWQNFKKAFGSGVDFSTITDEAMLLEYAGIAVQVVDGDAQNIKVTRPEDLEIAKKYLGGVNL